MGVAKITPFGKAIKKRLIDLDQNQNWLIDQIKHETGLYFDSSYMSKIMTGKLNTPGIVQAICEILEIQPTLQVKEDLSIERNSDFQPC